MTGGGTLCPSLVASQVSVSTTECTVWQSDGSVTRWLRLCVGCLRGHVASACSAVKDRVHVAEQAICSAGPAVNFEFRTDSSVRTALSPGAESPGALCMHLWHKQCQQCQAANARVCMSMVCSFLARSTPTHQARLQHRYTHRRSQSWHTLSAILPCPAAQAPQLSLILLHPHGWLGGCYDDQVVELVWRSAHWHSSQLVSAPPAAAHS